MAREENTFKNSRHPDSYWEGVLSVFLELRQW
jgi:hypothetical protein